MLQRKLRLLAITLGMGTWTVAGGADDVLPEYAPGEILIRVSGGAAKPTRAGLEALETLKNRYGLVGETRLFPPDPGRGAAAKVAGAPALHRWRRLRLSSTQDPHVIARDYARLELVEYAQPNYLRRPGGYPNDSLFTQQWNLEAMGWNGAELESAEEVVVAVIDSGLEWDHPDIASQVWVNAVEAEGSTGVDDDGNGYVDDWIGWDFSDAPGLPGQGDYLEQDNQPWDESGHGTHVAGIIAATVDNGRGIAGVAPGVQVMVLRAGFNLPQGGFLEDDDIAAAVVYAVDNGAHILNMSWGAPQFSPLIRDVVRYAAQAGCVLVAAAGNEGQGPVFMPARLDETIAVGAVDPLGRILAFSNPGNSIDLAAPGHQILSLAPNAGYATRSGTSMAASHVSGLAALILARNPHFMPQGVKGALLLTAQNTGVPDWDSRSGAGLAQIAAVHLDRVPGLHIAAPGTGTVVDSSSQVRVVLAGEGFTRYQLSWGGGENPLSWQILGREDIDGPGVFQAVWNTGGLQPGPYVLRARGLWQGRWLEERVAVQVAHRGPRVRHLRLSRALEGPSWEYLVEWDTDVPAGGRVCLFREGESEALYRIPAVPEHTAQRVRLPVELAPGDYRIQVKARTGEDKTTVVDVAGFKMGAKALALERFQEIARLPNGYLLGVLSDFDGNGDFELVQMGYDGRNYNAADYFAYKGGGPERVYSSSRLYIPWNIHDLDADSLYEVMAVDAQRVRLLESSAKGGFPDRLIWEKRDVWGGEVGDLDGDGRPEMYLRSSRSNLFQVFESSGNDQFAEIASLSNPTQGANDLGERQVIGDLDGDGQGELLCGDGDGDLFVFEGIADNALRAIWREEMADKADARVVGGGVDLDGDGRVEFIAARLFQDPFAPQHTRWEVQVYQALDDDTFGAEWQVEVLGGKASGNGISVVDLDEDGRVEFVLALVPHLYVFRSTAVDAYEPVWHAPATDTFRPAVGDLDGDGTPELAFNTGGRVGVFTLEQAPGALVAPPGFTAYARDKTRIVLGWSPVEGAGAYRIYRDDEILVSTIEDTLFEDREVAESVTYTYSIAALNSSLKVEGSRTAPIAVRVEGASRVLAVERISRHQLAVHFSTAMDISYETSYRYRVAPEVGSPSSVFVDRTRRRVVLSFTRTLPDSGRFALFIQNLPNPPGTPLEEESQQVEFELKPHREAVRLLGAEALSSTRISLEFSGPVVLPADTLAAFVFTDSRVRVRRIRLLELNKVMLDLEESTPLQPLGRRYRIRVQGLTDEAGRAINARVSISYAAANLNAVRVFPNPFLPARGGLKFGGLTPDSRVYIYDLGGRLVRVLEEKDQDGGVQWDGANASGEVVHSGVYLYRVVNATQAHQGKFVLVRE